MIMPSSQSVQPLANLQNSLPQPFKRYLLGTSSEKNRPPEDSNFPHTCLCILTHFLGQQLPNLTAAPSRLIKGDLFL